MAEQMQPQEHHSESQSKHGPPGPAMRRLARSLGQDGREILELAVKRDVIPRLVALPWIRPGGVPELKPQIGENGVKRLVALCLDADPGGVSLFVADLHRSGIGAGTIYESLLTPAARRLGVMWEEDTCTFADVTIGVLRLQNAQRAIAAHSLADAAPALGAPRALLMPVPGEQHTFGLSMVLDYFSRAGWDTRLGPAGTLGEALATVQDHRTELVGLSFACDDRVGDAKELIAAIRGASANKRLIIMVGGPSFVADPELAESLGADATATDGQQAVVRANDLLHPSPEARA